MNKIPEIYLDSDLYAELVDQGENPPGGDHSLGAFYKAVVAITDNGNTHVADLLNQTRQHRPDITTKHLANLLFRGIQFVEFGQGNLVYEKYKDPSEWHGELTKLLSSEDSRSTLARILRERSTTTTVYQRYAGPYAIIAYLFDGQSVSVADLGCGGNYGLRGMELREPFKPIDDFTPDSLLSFLLGQKINLERGLAIDKESPDDQEVRKWRFACSVYPKELTQIPSLKLFEERLREKSQKVSFLQADLVHFDWLPESVTDVVIISTTLYQLNPSDQEKFLDQAKRLLKPNGVLVVQDFARKDPQNPMFLDFSSSWFGKGFSYGTFLETARDNWKPLEALRWNNGRCTIVKPGEDFVQVFSRPEKLPLSIVPPGYSNSASAA